MRVGDWVVLAATVVTALGMGLALLLFSADGGQAVVTTPTETVTLPLTQDTVRSFTGKNGIVVTVEVANGAVRVRESDCPDHVCVNTGAISRGGASAACVPAGITVTVTADGEVDAVAD